MFYLVSQCCVQRVVSDKQSLGNLETSATSLYSLLHMPTYTFVNLPVTLLYSLKADSKIGEIQWNLCVSSHTKCLNHLTNILSADCEHSCFKQSAADIMTTAWLLPRSWGWKPERVQLKTHSPTHYTLSSSCFQLVCRENHLKKKTNHHSRS